MIHPHRWLRAAHKIAPNGALFPDTSYYRSDRTERSRPFPINPPKVRDLPSKFADSLNPLCFSLPSPACPHSVRRAAVRGFSLLFDIFPVCLVASLTDALSRSCGAVDIPAMQSQQTFPAPAPSASAPEACQPCVQHLFLLLDKPPAQRLSGAFARIPRSPLPCRCFVLEWLLTVAVPHITIYRIFNHTRTICSILIMASKIPLHQSAGAFSLLSGLEQVFQQRILE